MQRNDWANFKKVKENTNNIERYIAIVKLMIYKLHELTENVLKACNLLNFILFLFKETKEIG